MENFERIVMNGEVKLYFDIEHSTPGICKIKASADWKSYELLVQRNSYGEWKIAKKSSYPSAIKSTEFDIDTILNEIGKK
ncbi:hypothetical protein U0033_28185 [Chitinophaga sancti]|uniref:Uncharacterized protein n=1 Tax=Chitinophaga sancti TaxID=1004 RepID=A0ABZ0XQP0_9BACT|nr:hypothetical protein [Chitinophaga sancti]WQD61442.1 hypothetical protein U0033_26555 [Chitinophaga sancti]WQD61765.1 hypothetical protein U0033_28185 [Chitinophaga sancti]WQG92669.1 hypothetical protein SR876_14215 [Chitinophaga sancti]WQG93005.1 hypothetical protein SR876_15905 [Chitinophaga sancti]